MNQNGENYKNSSNVSTPIGEESSETGEQVNDSFHIHVNVFSVC